VNLPVALRQIADALESEQSAKAGPAESTPRYYTRRTAPIEQRAWDRAVQEIPTFRPGRELLVRCDDLHGWIESHPVERETTRPADESGPLDFAAFRRTALRNRGAR
jgi:hypothetical protein